MSKIDTLCVYCGSSTGRRPEYAGAARRLAQHLAREGIELVYGGASVGVMGILADAALEAGGAVTGIIPKDLVDQEIAHEGLTRLEVVASMHERKARMADTSDGFVALPGGMGTLEELFEVLTWGQLGLHYKPCGLFNVSGYYDALAAFLDHTVTEEFVKEKHRAMLVMEEEPEELLRRFEAYEPPGAGKWIDKENR